MGFKRWVMQVGILQTSTNWSFKTNRTNNDSHFLNECFTFLKMLYFSFFFSVNLTKLFWCRSGKYYLFFYKLLFCLVSFGLTQKSPAAWSCLFSLQLNINSLALSLYGFCLKLIKNAVHEVCRPLVVRFYVYLARD